MKKIFLLYVFISTFSFAQSITENFEQKIFYKTPILTSVASPTKIQANQLVTYFDGFGRSIQTIENQQSTSGKNIIHSQEYDALGQQEKKYLPYVSALNTLNYETDFLTKISAFYSNPSLINTGNPNFESTTNPYSQIIYEASALNRPLKIAQPGNSWNSTLNHDIKLEYETNKTIDEIKFYKLISNWDSNNNLYNISNLVDNGFYPQNQIYKKIIKNENWIVSDILNNTSQEYRNSVGNLILKRTFGNSIIDGIEVNSKHDTYYVYDQYGNLSYVIPPLANGAIDVLTLNNLCYLYKYDNRNRLVEKKLPGKQWEFIVYDKLDRVIATGPTLSPFGTPNTVGWMITKYDVFNRPVYTGWEQSATINNAARLLKQNTANGLTTISETKTTSGTIDGIQAFYSNNISPTTFKLLSVNYYDDYSFPNAPTTFATVEGETVFYTNSMKPKGMPTGSWVRAVSTISSIIGETSSILYDKKARPIRTYLSNYLGGYTQVDSKLDFIGKTNYTITYHKRNAVATVLKIRDNYTYTNQDRLSIHTQTINDVLPAQLIAKNTYDELGQLISKNVGGTDATGIVGLQKVDYSYNIRGWLTGINDINSLASSSGAGAPDLFAFKINYNTVEGNAVGVEPLYNGNISETYWRTSSDNTIRKYGYQYDNLNRLKNAIYQKPGNTTPIPNSYNESMSYDKNGNIKMLSRKGNYEDSANFLLIDNLNYFYGSNNTNNQLMKVTDATNNPSGFKDDSTGLNDTMDDYAYDLNGNMTRDDNKKIATITYNHLNLPLEIIFTPATPVKKINYLYNAAGQKLKKTVTNGTVINTTDYLSGFQYLQATTAGTSVLKFFPTAEGYVNNTVVGANNTYNYVYNYTDHLGNVRLSYTKLAGSNVITIMQESHYYPFGLQQSGYNMTKLDYEGGDGVINLNPCTNCPNNYKYNGKELQSELGLNMYDYGARNYMPDIGRWGNIDPLAETSTQISPFVYCLNNPIYFIDPDGLDEDEHWVKRENGSVYWDDEAVSPETTNAGETYLGAEYTYYPTEKNYMINLHSDKTWDYGTYFERDSNGQPIKTIDSEIHEDQNEPYGVGMDLVDAVAMVVLAEFVEGYIGFGSIMGFGPKAVISETILVESTVVTENVAAKGGGNILSTTTRVGKNGNAVEVLFKNGGKMDINAARVKEWVPNLHPNAPAGKLNKVKFDNFLSGSKGFKRTPTPGEIDFLNGLFK